MRYKHLTTVGVEYGNLTGLLWGHAVEQLVEATSRKVAGSIPDGVTGIFY